jgi:hypothetical protein
MADFLSAAQGAVSAAQSLVTQAINKAQSNADNLRAVALATLQQMANQAPPELPDAPELEVLDLSLGDLALPTVGQPPPIGEFAEAAPSAPNTNTTLTATAPTINDFNPSVGAIVIPEAPADRAFVPPTAPVVNTHDVPSAPSLDTPVMPTLENIVIPTFEFPTLPTFDATAPTFVDTALAAVIEWVPEEYQVEILDEAMAKLRGMWDGELGLPPAVEQALWERAAAREDLAISRDVSQAYIEFSSRGFTLPPGALVARVDAIREEGTIKKLALQREVLLKVADTQIENLRTAVTQSLAAESVLVGIWNSMSQRRLEIARAELDASLAVYNARIAVFNAQQSAYATEATVYRSKLEGELARIQVFRAELDGELARGQLNEQRVRIYTQQFVALQSAVELYKARLQGVSTLVDMDRNRMETYRTQVMAFAEEVRADKTRFEAYDSRMRGEAAKANVLEAEARAYASYVQGQATRADVSVKIDGLKIEEARLQVQAFQAKVEAYRAKVASYTSQIEERLKSYQAGSSVEAARASALSDQARARIAEADVQLRHSVSQAQVHMQRYSIQLENAIRLYGMQQESLKSAGAMASTLAAGAMAGVSTGASIQGQGSLSGTGYGSTNQNIAYDGGDWTGV